MANRKISEFTELTAPASGDYLPIVDISEVGESSKNKRITIGELFRSIPSGSAASPGIAFESGDTSGFYYDGSNIGASISGSSVVVFSSGLTSFSNNIDIVGQLTVSGSVSFGGSISLPSGASYQIDNISVLSNTTLGSGIVNSSLTKVATLVSGALGSGFTTIATSQGGTGQISYSAGQLLIGKSDGTLAKATLTAGSGVSISNGDGSITIDASGTGGTITNVGANSPLSSTSGTTPVISIQDASTSQKGAVQLTDSTSSTSITTAATPASVKSAYDLANAALPKSGGTMSGNIIFSGTQPTATTSSANIVQLTDSTSSTSTTSAATPNSVKSAYDLANAALPKAGGALTGDITLNAQSDVRFADADSSHYVGFQAPATITSSLVWTLPAADATVSGQVLSSNGAGILSWATGGGGSSSSVEPIILAMIF